jgi:hypothetical protein
MLFLATKRGGARHLEANGDGNMRVPAAQRLRQRQQLAAPA